MFGLFGFHAWSVSFPCLVCLVSMFGLFGVVVWSVWLPCLACGEPMFGTRLPRLPESLPPLWAAEKTGRGGAKIDNFWHDSNDMVIRINKQNHSLDCKKDNFHQNPIKNFYLTQGDFPSQAEEHFTPRV